MLSCPVLATPHPRPASCVFRLRAGRLPRLPRPCRGASQGAAYIAAASPMIGNFRVSPFHFPLPSKFFRMNTCKSVLKQRTLTLFRMNTYKKQGGGAHFAQFWCNVTPFRINTCKSVSKQRTLTPFRMNTYKKHRGRGGCYC